jgi:hypothetical protein
MAGQRSWGAAWLLAGLLAGCSADGQAGQEGAQTGPAASAALGEPVAEVAQAATGVCDSNSPTSTQACIDQIQANGGTVINDIFRDTLGHKASELSTFGKLFNAYPGCDRVNIAGCDPGTSQPPYDCPGEYSCVSGPGFLTPWRPRSTRSIAPGASPAASPTTT